MGIPEKKIYIVCGDRYPIKVITKAHFDIVLFSFYLTCVYNLGYIANIFKAMSDLSTFDTIYIYSL